MVCLGECYVKNTIPYQFKMHIELFTGKIMSLRFSLKYFSLKRQWENKQNKIGKIVRAGWWVCRGLFYLKANFLNGSLNFTMFSFFVVAVIAILNSLWSSFSIQILVCK